MYNNIMLPLQVTQPQDKWCMNQTDWEEFLNSFHSIEDLNCYIKENGVLTDQTIQARRLLLSQVCIFHSILNTIKY